MTEGYLHSSQDLLKLYMTEGQDLLKLYMTEGYLH